MQEISKRSPTWASALHLHQLATEIRMQPIPGRGAIDELIARQNPPQQHATGPLAGSRRRQTETRNTLGDGAARSRGSRRKKAGCVSCADRGQAGVIGLQPAAGHRAWWRWISFIGDDEYAIAKCGVEPARHAGEDEPRAAEAIGQQAGREGGGDLAAACSTSARG